MFNFDIARKILYFYVNDLNLYLSVAFLGYDICHSSALLRIRFTVSLQMNSKKMFCNDLLNLVMCAVPSSPQFKSDN